jgi:hypothetical protein
MAVGLRSSVSKRPTFRKSPKISQLAQVGKRFFPMVDRLLE